MATWSSRRKTTYGLITTTILVLLIGIPTFKFFYKAPTCFDGIQNGGEFGIDCGGGCQRLCQGAFLPPRIEWGGAKLEKLTDGLYNASSYIVNPNINGAAVNAPYKISLYDAQGLFITDRTGVMTLYPRRNALAFQTAINTNERVPVKATFEFTSAPNWFKSSDQLGGIAVIDKKYTEDENGASLEVILENKTLSPYKNLQVSAVLYDVSGNVIGFSQTKLDSLGVKGSREIAPFTWPVNHEGAVASIEVLITVEPQQL